MSTPVVDRDQLWQQLGGDELYLWLDQTFITPISAAAARRGRALRLSAADIAQDCWAHVWSNLAWYAERIQDDDLRPVRAALGRVADDSLTTARNQQMPDWLVYSPHQVERLLQRHYLGAAESDGETVRVKTSRATTSDLPAEMLDLSVNLGKLSATQRAAVEARYAHPGTWADIAEVVAVPETALRKAYSRALRTLVSTMSGYSDSPRLEDIAA